MLSRRLGSASQDTSSSSSLAQQRITSSFAMMLQRVSLKSEASQRCRGTHKDGLLVMLVYVYNARQCEYVSSSAVLREIDFSFLHDCFLLQIFSTQTFSIQTSSIQLPIHQPHSAPGRGAEAPESWICATFVTRPPPRPLSPVL